MQRNVDGGPPRDVDASDPGAPTINVKNIDDGPPSGAGAEDAGAPTINGKKRRRRTIGRCRS
jgi:hypothetical protein